MFSMIAEPPTRIGNSAPIRVTIDCAQCGTAIPSTQTKSLDSTLDTYRVGDVVSAEGITTGVLTEELYWPAQRERRRVTGLLYRVLGVVESYANYAASEDKEAFLNEPFGFMVRADLKEHLAAADPLKSIVEEYRKELGRAGREVGWP